MVSQHVSHGPQKNFWGAMASYYWNWIHFTSWTLNWKRGLLLS